MSNSRSDCCLLRDISNYLHYDKDTGNFRWRSTIKGRMKNSVAGAFDKDGYRVIFFRGKPFKAHRLAWFMHYGVLPNKSIDHINRIRDDNRISNLRLATPFEQGRNRGSYTNNSSGHVGVTWSSSANKWLAQVCYNKKTHYAGLHSHLEDAVMAREEIKRKLLIG